MTTAARHKNDLLHLEAMVIRLEQLSISGDSIAATSLVGQPAYWRGRIGMLLESAGVSTADRELARALLRRLARIPESRGHPMAANERAHTWERT